MLNAQYEALASHYVMFIIPVQVRKTKTKSCSRGCSGKTATAVIASLRHETFTSFALLEQAIRKKLVIYKARLFLNPAILSFKKQNGLNSVVSFGFL